MWECPINCKKYRNTTETVFNLYTENGRLNAQIRQNDRNFDKLIELSQEYLLLGVEKRAFHGGEETLVAVITRASEVSYSETRTLRLFRLPYTRAEEAVSEMDIFLHSKGRVHLVNWYAIRYEANDDPPKYGGRLMRYLLAYLRTAGFRTLTAEISRVDYDHLDQLKAIYSHFGFEQSEEEDHYRLRLKLFNSSVCHDNYEEN